MRILIAEDEVEIARALKVLLEKNKCSVDIVHNGKDAWDYISQGKFDVVVLDIMMPGPNGYAKSEIEDRVAGLNAGADDYLPKPFAASEFIARVKALGRRSLSYTESLIRVGDTTLDCNRFELSAGDVSVRLNNKEYQLMELLIRNQGIYLSSADLLVKIWGYDTDAELGVVWVYISYLRKRLTAVGSSCAIRAKRNVGYTLEAKA